MSIKLTYFDIRGFGEPARLILKYANVDFEDVRISKEDWPQLKPNTKTGKVPFLEVDGHTLVESYAIDRFLARRYGLAGKDEFEEAEVDGWADLQKDFYNQIAPWFYPKMGYREGNADDFKKDLDAGVERFLPLYSEGLKESGSGFLVKSGLTWADFVVSEFLMSMHMHAPELFEKYPNLVEYLERMKSIPQLKEHYATRNLA